MTELFLGSVGTTGHLIFLLLFSWLKNLKRAHKSFINAHHRTSIVEFTTVVWGREDCDEATLSKKFISILNYLMCTTD